MKFIIEGPEGSGKTTLANHLAKLFHLSPHHAGGAPKNKEELFERVQFIEGEKFGIFDRHPFVSEFVYGFVLRGESLLPVIRPSGFLIYCRPPTDILLEQLVPSKEWKSQEEAAEIITHRRKIVHRYDMFFQLVKFDAVYDFTKGGKGICVE